MTVTLEMNKTELNIYKERKSEVFNPFPQSQEFKGIRGLERK